MSARAIPSRGGVLSILATTLSGAVYPLDLPLYSPTPARPLRRRGGAARQRRRERQRREREARRRQRGRR